MLTKRQKQILDYIKKFIKENDYAPTIEEIKNHFRLSSLATVHKHIENLRGKRYLRKIENQPRSIQLNNKRKLSDLIQIPLLGTIAAGTPIEAIEIPETINIPKNDIGRFGDHFALRVEGNSMIDDGVYDGDVVVIKQQSIADNGQMVVAIIDDNEATLKRIYHEKDSFRLQPANPSLFPIYKKMVEIRGIVVKIIRNFEKQAKKIKTPDNLLQRRIDYSWDFNGAKTKPYTHGLHTYPAMFIPQVAKRLLLSYSQKGDTICDIFCGINRIRCRISKSGCKKSRSYTDRYVFPDNSIDNTFLNDVLDEKRFFHTS